jgi:hypothetical protein
MQKQHTCLRPVSTVLVCASGESQSDCRPCSSIVLCWWAGSRGFGLVQLAKDRSCYTPDVLVKLGTWCLGWGGLIGTKFVDKCRLRSYDPGNTQPRPILEVKQGSALISSMVGDHIRTERDVVHPLPFFLRVLLAARW